MLLGSITLIVAISISGIAAYYSIIGLTAIFSAAFLPIVLMGSALEVGKILSTIWLHQNWRIAPLAIKGYLVTAVALLMFITSMGVFGFLSKAHVEQTALSDENSAQIERIMNEISRQETIISKAENKINDIEAKGTGSNIAIQSQIDKEQKRLDKISENVRIAELDSDKRLKPLNDEISRIDDVLDEMQSAINAQDVRKLQAIVGAAIDGVYGPDTASRVDKFRDDSRTRKDDILKRINEIRNSGTESIKLLREQANDVANSIKRLRNKTGNESETDIQALIDKHNLNITRASRTIDDLVEDKYKLETAYRKLEAEVGPVKYIAEVIYDDPEKQLLEEAVRWVIIIIVAVFDPLAICLVLAATITITQERTKSKKRNNIKEMEMKIEEYNKVLEELEKFLDQKQSDSEEYDKLKTQYASVMTNQQELVDALEKELVNSKTLNDRILASESEKNEYSRQAKQMNENLLASEDRIGKLNSRIKQLETEIQIRDSIVEKMAEKYNLVEKDPFIEEIEKDVSAENDK